MATTLTLVLSAKRYWSLRTRGSSSATTNVCCASIWLPPPRAAPRFAGRTSCTNLIRTFHCGTHRGCLKWASSLHSYICRRLRNSALLDAEATVHVLMLVHDCVRLGHSATELSSFFAEHPGDFDRLDLGTWQLIYAQESSVWSGLIVYVCHTDHADLPPYSIAFHRYTSVTMDNSLVMDFQGLSGTVELYWVLGETPCDRSQRIGRLLSTLMMYLTLPWWSSTIDS